MGEGDQPRVLIIAGPNGDAKTTFAREFLPAEGNCLHYVNAGAANLEQIYKYIVDAWACTIIQALRRDYWKGATTDERRASYERPGR